MTPPALSHTAVTSSRSLEILHALASYHGLRAGDDLTNLVRATEEGPLSSFYKHHPSCACPSQTILLCIIEELK